MNRGVLQFRPSTEAQVQAEMLAARARYRGEERGRISKRGFGRYGHRRNEISQTESTYRDGWYFDTASVAAGAAFAKIIFFSTAQGSSKYLNSTNLTGNPGQIPAGEQLILRSIRVIISNTTVPADFANIMGNCSMQFKIKNVPIWQWTPEWLPAGCGAYTAAVGNLGTLPSGTASVVSTSNAFPVQTASYEFNENPYMMESLLPFSVEINPDVAFNMTASSGVNPVGVGTTIRVYLEGKQTKVVAV